MQRMRLLIVVIFITVYIIVKYIFGIGIGISKCGQWGVLFGEEITCKCYGKIIIRRGSGIGPASDGGGSISCFGVATY